MNSHLLTLKAHITESRMILSSAEIFEASSTSSVDPEKYNLGPHYLLLNLCKRANKQIFSDVVILLAFSGLNHIVCVFTEVFCRKMKQLLSNKTTPHFQLLPMSKVDKS